MTTNIFEQAVRNKLRFQTNKGMISVEALYDLPLESKSGTDLDSVAKDIARKLANSEEESFVKTKKTKDVNLSLSMDVVKHIIAVKLAEAEAFASAKEKAILESKILERLSRKEEEALDNKSEDELRAMLEKVRN